MKKRMISLFLALVALLGILPVTSLAAPTLEEAMAEVNVYARSEVLDWLTMNGSVKEQHYTYYNYRSEQTGHVKEIPAYCVDPRCTASRPWCPRGRPSSTPPRILSPTPRSAALSPTAIPMSRCLP